MTRRVAVTPCPGRHYHQPHWRLHRWATTPWTCRRCGTQLYARKFGDPMFNETYWALTPTR